MAASANEVCHHLLHQLRLSNLNFVLSETPYSAQIILRKRFLKEFTGPSFQISSNSTVTQEIQDLIKQNDLLSKENACFLNQLESIRNNSRETIDILEEKISKAEAAALQSYKEKNTESGIFKKLVKDLNDEIANNKKDLNLKNKAVKEKEKEILKLDQKCTNLASNINNFKSEISTLKQEKKKLVKQKSEKPKKAHNVSTNTTSIRLDDYTSPVIVSSPSTLISIPSTSLLGTTTTTDQQLLYNLHSIKLCPNQPSNQWTSQILLILLH